MERNIRKSNLLRLIFTLLSIILLTSNISFSQTSDDADKKLTKRERIEKYFMDGVNYYIGRDFKNAAEMWKKVLDLEPSHKRARMYFEKAFNKYQDMQVNYYKGLKKYKANECRDAIPYFKKALLINPRHEKARQYLNLSYECIKVTVKIVKKTDKNAEPVKEVQMTTDDVLNLYAIGFDGKGNYVGTVDVTWEVTGTLDAIKQKEPSSKLKFAPSTFDTSGTIKAIPDNGYAGETGTIKVVRGRLAYIKIMDSPNYSGKEVKKIRMTTDDTLKLYAAGFDKKDVYIGDVPVDWHTEGELDKVDVQNSPVLEFSPSKANVKGKIVAEAKIGNAKVSIDDIIITHGKLHYVRIEDAPDGKGKEVYNLTISIDEKVSLYSLGYDAKDNYIGNIKVDWESTLPIKKIKMNNLSEITIIPTEANTEGTINITKKGIIGDSTGKINVTTGNVSAVQFVKDGNQVLKDKKFRAYLYVPTSIEANGVDSQGNLVKSLSGDWRVSYEDKDYVVASNAHSVNLEFSNIISKAELKFTSDEASGNLGFEVDYPKIVMLKLLNATNNEVITDIFLNYKEKIELISGGFDSKDNYIKPVNAHWETTGDLEKFANNYGEKNEYTANIGDLKGDIILETEELGKIKVGRIVIGPAPVVKKVVESKKVVVYYVYNGDTLSRIISKLLRVPYKWIIVKKYVYAIGTYNKLENSDLIFPKEPIYMPYITIENNTTTAEIAKKIYGDEKFKNRIIVYKQPWKTSVSPDDKIVVRDVRFLSTGKLNFIVEKDEVDNNENLINTNTFGITNNISESSNVSITNTNVNSGITNMSVTNSGVTNNIINTIKSVTNSISTNEGIEK